MRKLLDGLSGIGLILLVVIPVLILAWQQFFACPDDSRYGELKCLVRRNLHFSTDFVSAVNRDTVAVLEREVTEHDVPVLVAMLGDDEMLVGLAAEEVLESFGEVAVEPLQKVVQEGLHPRERAAAMLSETLATGRTVRNPSAFVEEKEGQLRRSRELAEKALRVLGASSDAMTSARRANSGIAAGKRADIADGDAGQNEQAALQTDVGGVLRINADFYDHSKLTGGDYFFWAPGEFGRYAGRIIPGYGENVLLAYGESGPEKHILIFPVDVSMSQFTLLVGLQRKDWTDVTRPDGMAVHAGDPGIKLTETRHMFFLRVEDPQPGTWQVAFQGAGVYGASVRSAASATDRSSIKLINFELLQHSGWLQRDRYEPVEPPFRIGDSHICRVFLAGEITGAAFEFVDAGGASLASLALKAYSGENREFRGRCRIPSQPFRLRVTGTDRAGYPFQRVTSTLWAPE